MRTPTSTASRTPILVTQSDGLRVGNSLPWWSLSPHHPTRANMTTENINGFPPGYFLIRAIHSDYYGKRMLLDVAHSERRPGVELVLWVDEVQSTWQIKHQHEDSQIFFTSGDGLLRSKASGHPIGWQIDKETSVPKLVVQTPRPFNFRPQPQCQFKYDIQSGNITTRLPHEVLNTIQSFELKRRGTDVSQTSISISVTSADEAKPPASPNTGQNYALEVVPRGHRQSKIVQFFDSVLESPSEEPDQPPSSPAGKAHRHGDQRNDSWHKGREVKLSRERSSKRSHFNKLQQWEIIPLSCASCDATSETWAIQ
ncbi:hypothetical protein RSOLAG1IB_04244 [Rhizoctonia solani AG-1 IB]|uniref:Uncharacterized protein n=1 Tax=Thanatephorus cucumeris (strain AG1-IB / isolate 7/3/14) TaxID=1108050 RepID=A0A0B7FTI5_THACB|nr:hypothetical protein RSOLAG1IB_04244 [Rhizoctonia solani AG-1 IB]